MSAVLLCRTSLSPKRMLLRIFPYILLDDTSLIDYALKMVQVISNNVLLCGNVFKNRMHMYLETREIAKNFVFSES